MPSGSNVVGVTKWRFRRVIALSAGLGLVAPALFYAFGEFFGAEGDWLLLLFPAGVTLLGDSRQPPTPIETMERIAFALGLNVVLYLVLGTIVWGLFTFVQRLRSN
jgi:hypothetical protein